MLTKELIDDVIKLGDFINSGFENSGKKLKEPNFYNDSVVPKLEAFEKEYQGSPNKIFRDELEFIRGKFELDSKIASSGRLSFHGQSLNKHVWAPLFLEKVGYKNSIQLYVWASKDQIKFGIGYGSDIKEDSKFVKIIQEDNSIQEKLFSIIDSNPNIKFYDESDSFNGTNITSPQNLGNLWNHQTNILGKLKANEIPDNAGEIIETVLGQLAPIFNEIVLKSKRDENMPVNEPNPKMKNSKKDKEEDSKPKYPLNQILYGPPGTGKTYHTINKALEIIGFDHKGKPLTKEKIKELDETDRTKLKHIFDYHINTSGQIVFTTFHQSMSYEDFVEGIKPQEPKTEEAQISYKVEDGIFKRICNEAIKTNKSVVKIEGDEEELTQEVFQQYYEAFTSKLPSQSETNSIYTLLTPKSKKTFKLFKNSANSIIVKAGTEEVAMCISSNELTKVFFENKKPIYKSYEKTLIDKILENTEYKKITIDNSTKPYVLIIDEINRGNVSAIFGELITLIEKDKRIDGDEELKVVLPYSKNKDDKFGVPLNLYIIGTMNTADRSVEALDSALRRRFNFIETPPNPRIIKTAGKLKNQGNLIVNKFEIDLVKLLTTINNRIEILLDRDHLIGHSYLMSVKDETTLKEAFSKKIIPLLQEYFYGDYGKISLVLGEGFCKGEKSNKQNLFAVVDDYDTSVFEEKLIYRIQDIENESFVIADAIKILLKQSNSSSSDK